MNRSMMPKQVMAYNQGGIASFIPQQTQIMGQPHRLAYVNPQEEQMMLNQGGAGTPGPGGIPAYWTLTEPSTWAGGSNYEKGAGYQGLGNFNASDNIGTGGNSASDEASDKKAQEARMAARAAANNDDNNTQTMTIGEYTDSLYAPGSNSNQTSNDNVGFVDSLAMGFGFKDKTPAYYATTANTIAASQGPKAAQNYLNRLSDDGTISANDWQNFSDASSQVPINETLQNVGNNDNNNDNTVVVDDGTVDDGTVDDGTVDGEEEIQYTQMKPFYGGYQPSTRADTLVPSQGRGIGSYLPNPRLDPIFPQQPPQDFYHTDGPGFPPIDPGFNIDPGPIDKGRTFDFGAPANLGDTHYNPELDTTYTYQEKPNGQGGFYSGWDITQGNGPEMELYGGGGSQGLMINNDLLPRNDAIQPVQETLNTNEPTQVDELRSNFSDRINRIAQTAGYAGNTDLGKVLSGGIELTDYTNPLTGVIGEAPVLSGGFNSMEELMAYQNQNPSANLMGEYQRLKALQGGNTNVAGVASMFGNEQAPPYMYQGIMG